MARLSTCKGCGKKLQPEEKHIHSSKTYCEECFKKIERDSTEYKQLIEFICNNYELEKPTGFMLKQIKELRTEYGYSYAAMTYTLWYCKEMCIRDSGKPVKNLCSQLSGFTLNELFDCWDDEKYAK